MSESPNRCWPINFGTEDKARILSERKKIGESLVKVGEINWDRSVKFKTNKWVGESEQHLRLLFQLIHTRDWNPKLPDPFLEELAEKCVGYCGVDIKSLCREAALIVLRRRYPQIYASSQKLQLDIFLVVLSARDFYHAMKKIVPASQCAMTSPGHPLSPAIRPLLEQTFSNLLCILQEVFPHVQFSKNNKKDDAESLLLDYSEQENTLSIFRSKYRLDLSTLYSVSATTSGGSI
ncbi:hypothetical protein GDO86_005909 [Hymenochirus boettgeri]|uniref:AAA ATPase AAA+ lid domain-containing protein n=1 Tax=Hymenochirus boettgeri TaxID=247094 RepID=A0A8T2J909_9PIPI|nr:hypothetical protein GDO86_005909 [Hymenochirus boettgeri]